MGKHAHVEVRGQLMETNSPFTLWSQDSELGSSLGIKCPYPLSHLPGPVQNFKKSIDSYLYYHTLIIFNNISYAI